MFNKLVSNLPYNPGLINQVSFYAKRMHEDSAIRRMGFIFIAIAMVVQIFATMYPAQKSLASSPNHIINGLSDNRSSVLSAWDNNTGNVRAIYRKFGVEREQLAAMTATASATVKSTSADWWSIGRLPLSSFGVSGSQWGERTVNAEGNIIYQRPLKAWDKPGTSSTYSAFKGVNKLGKPFWILKDCGNLTFQGAYLPSPPAPKLEVHKTLLTSNKVKPGDTIKFRLEYRNTVDDSLATNFKLTDIVNSSLEVVSLSGMTSRNGNTLTISRDNGLGYTANPVSQTLVVKVKSGVKAGTVICNQAIVSSTQTGAKSSEKPCVTVMEQSTPTTVDQVCVDLESGKINVSGSKSSLTITAPNGYLVSQYCVKASSINQSLGPELIDVNPDTKSVTIRHSSGKDISHYSYSTVKQTTPQAPAPTPTPTPAPSPNPGPTPPTPIPAPAPAPPAPVTSGYCVASYIQGSATASTVKITTEVFTEGSTKVTGYSYDVAENGTIDYNAVTSDKTHTQTISNLPAGQTTTVAVRAQLANGTAKTETAVCPIQVTANEIARVVQSKSVSNITTSTKNANNTLVKVGDTLEFKLNTENVTTSDYKNYQGQDYFGDVLNYAQILDKTQLEKQGITLDSNGYLKWNTALIKANSTDVKTVVVKIKDTIPATNQPSSASHDFDCVISNKYGNEVVMNVNCPLVKSIEQGTGKLPNTGPGAGMVISVSLAMIAGYFFMRSRLMAKELDLVRAEFNHGGI